MSFLFLAFLAMFMLVIAVFAGGWWWIVTLPCAAIIILTGITFVMDDDT